MKFFKNQAVLIVGLVLVAAVLAVPSYAQADSTGCGIVNASFETIVDGKPVGWGGDGHATQNTGWMAAVPDGTAYGYHTGGEPMYQNVGIVPGATYSLTFWSASHAPGFQAVTMAYLSGERIVASVVHTISHDIDTDKLMGGPYMLMLGAAPANVSALRISIANNGVDWAKVDDLCLTERTAQPVETATATATATATHTATTTPTATATSPDVTGTLTSTVEITPPVVETATPSPTATPTIVPTIGATIPVTPVETIEEVLCGGLPCTPTSLEQEEEPVTLQFVRLQSFANSDGDKLFAVYTIICASPITPLQIDIVMANRPTYTTNNVVCGSVLYVPEYAQAVIFHSGEREVGRYKELPPEISDPPTALEITTVYLPVVSR